MKDGKTAAKVAEKGNVENGKRSAGRSKQPAGGGSKTKSLRAYPRGEEQDRGRLRGQPSSEAPQGMAQRPGIRAKALDLPLCDALLPLARAASVVPVLRPAKLVALSNDEGAG